MEIDFVMLVRELVTAVGVPGAVVLAGFAVLWRALPPMLGFLDGINQSLQSLPRLTATVESLRQEMGELREEMRALRNGAPPVL